MSSHKEESIAANYAKVGGLWYGKMYNRWYVGTKKQLEIVGIKKYYQ
jgi:hypothetical protein